MEVEDVSWSTHPNSYYWFIVFIYHFYGDPESDVLQWYDSGGSLSYQVFATLGIYIQKKFGRWNLTFMPLTYFEVLALIINVILKSNFYI